MEYDFFVGFSGLNNARYSVYFICLIHTMLRLFYILFSLIILISMFCRYTRSLANKEGKLVK
jgi:hypothetical protein